MINRLDYILDKIRQEKMLYNVKVDEHYITNKINVLFPKMGIYERLDLTEKILKIERIK
jgi:hypothetical protein